jgi:hypothetical protein
MGARPERPRTSRFTPRTRRLDRNAPRGLALLAAYGAFVCAAARAAHAQALPKKDADVALAARGEPLADGESTDIRVHFEGSVPGTRFYYRASDAVLRSLAEQDETKAPEAPYLLLCTAPCDTTMRPGAYRMALATGDGKPVEADDWIFVQTPGTMNGRYASRSALRTAAWIVAPVLALAGVSMMVGANSWNASNNQSFQDCVAGPMSGPQCSQNAKDSQNGARALWATGLITAVLSVPAVLVLATRSDGAEISVSPGGMSFTRVPLLGSPGRPVRTEGIATNLSFQVSF